MCSYNPLLVTGQHSSKTVWLARQSLSGKLIVMGTTANGYHSAPLSTLLTQCESHVLTQPIALVTYHRLGRQLHARNHFLQFLVYIQ